MPVYLDTGFFTHKDIGFIFQTFMTDMLHASEAGILFYTLGVDKHQYYGFNVQFSISLCLSG